MRVVNVGDISASNDAANKLATFFWYRWLMGCCDGFYYKAILADAITSI